jgi:hypothetical protein
MIAPRVEPQDQRGDYSQYLKRSKAGAGNTAIQTKVITATAWRYSLV